MNTDSSIPWDALLPPLVDALSSAALGAAEKHQALLQLQAGLANQPGFQEALDQARQVRHTALFSHTLFTDARVHVGLLGIYRHQPVPIHDHPGCAGGLVLLQGRASLSEYQPLGRLDGLYRLERSAHREMEAGEAHSFTSRHGNIHGLQAQSELCLALTAHVPSVSRNQRTLYFVLSSTQTATAAQIATHPIRAGRLSTEI